MKNKILVLLFSPVGRDPEALIPLLWYLENIFYYQVEVGFLFDGKYLIHKLRPQVLLITGITGSSWHVEIANYAFQKKILVITLTSEGLFNQVYLDNWWSNYKEKKKNWDLQFLWSEKFLKMTQKFLPQYKNSFAISGSTGLDRYAIYKFLPKKDFLIKVHKNKYKKIVMYAGFAFSFYCDQKKLCKLGYENQLANFQKELIATKKILQQVIINNPDVLFILKRHPGEPNEHMEIDYDWHYANVLFFYKEQLAFSDLISVCDIFLVYESTSSFEAFALKKPVINIYPSSRMDWFRHEAYKGNALATNYHDLQKMIDEFFDKHEIQAFTQKNILRKKLIKNNVDAIDGLNSYRTAQKINKFIQTSDKKTKDLISFNIKAITIHCALLILRPLYLWGLFKNSIILKNYAHFKEFYQLQKKYYPQIKSFYKKS